MAGHVQMDWSRKVFNILRKKYLWNSCSVCKDRGASVGEKKGKTFVCFLRSLLFKCLFCWCPILATTRYAFSLD